jgi:hypothetical protein
MVIRVIVLLRRQLFRLLLLCCRTSRSKDIELLVLRQEVAILRRQMNRPRVKPEERMVLAVLQRLRPVWERTSSLVTPDTLRRWHRELIRRKWTQPHRVRRGQCPNRPSSWYGGCPRRISCGATNAPRVSCSSGHRDLGFEHPPGHRPGAAARAQTRHLEQVHAKPGCIDRCL